MGELSPTDLQAAARRLAALADRLRAVRTQLGGDAGDATRPEPGQRPAQAGDPPGERSEGQPH